jgi:hypothetical protein
MADEILIVDCVTGEQTRRPLTPEEEAERDAADAEAEAARIEAQRDEAEHVQVANTNETDWIITPPPDTPQDILNQIANNLAGWQAFRQGLRALPIDTIPDPAHLVWPTHPIRPATALTPPPAWLTGPP